MFRAVTISKGHDNFFTPLRIIMALMVVFGHAFVVYYGASDFEPKVFLHYTPSYLAVNAFFIASGFLVTGSMLYRGDLREFGAARVLRIYPALFVHVVIVAFVLGAIMTTLPLADYFMDPQVLAQPAFVLSFYDTDMILPGVFTSNAEQLSSATLWTLRYELLAYMATAIMFATGLMHKKWMIAAPFVLSVIGWIAAHRLGIFDAFPATVQSILRFSVAYGLGAALYAYQDFIRLYWPMVLVFGLMTWLLKSTPEVEILMNVTIGAAVFTLAYMKVPKLDKLKGATDTSYGIYIYHWAVLQTIKAILPDIGLWTLMITATLITLLIAYASWIWIEKPALALKPRFSAWLSRRPPEAAPAK
ncbi:acyltransferase family protein [Robiginitomaculum antarcticum]|uniref:acyltransferase family protein n=1 Tax=Robiginitomaculum antarcticum TaxID=437507 RepID=UPI00036946D8|nr:acyltransferase [Robiginitomaculum antarcticum]